MKIYESINKNNWCQNSMCVSNAGEDLININAPEAEKWCAFGWILKVYPEKQLSKALHKIYTVLDKRQLIDWNDVPERKFKDVKALFKKCNL